MKIWKYELKVDVCKSMPTTYYSALRVFVCDISAKVLELFGKFVCTNLHIVSVYAA